jgi:hypothetical protein
MPAYRQTMGPLKEFCDGFLECSEISSYHVLFKEAMRDFHSRFMFNMFLRSCKINVSKTQVLMGLH